MFSQSIQLNKLKENFGIEVILKTKADLERYYNGADLAEAQAVADRWLKNAEG